MKLLDLLFHGLLYSSVFFPYLQNTNRYEEVLTSVYSKEIMHAVCGGPGYLWM